jgi:hypothetical protein
MVTGATCRTTFAVWDGSWQDQIRSRTIPRALRVIVLRRFFLAMIMSLVAASPVSAESLPGQLARCLRNTGLLQRLACYDGVVKDAGITAPTSSRPAPASPYASVQAAPIPAPMGAPVLTSAAPMIASPAAASSFGSESLPRARMPPNGSAKAITAGVTNLAFDGTGHFTVTLDNGQVWRQMAGDVSILRQTQVSSVHIVRSVFGSYDLSLPSLHASYRVVRIQ